MAMFDTLASLFAQSGIVGPPLLVVLVLALGQAGRVIHARVRGRPEGCGHSQLGAILVLGVIGACIGVLGTLVGMWHTAGWFTTAGEVPVALVWSSIRVALTPSIIGFAILSIASVAWLALHYRPGRGRAPTVLCLAVLGGTSCIGDRGGVSGTAARRDSAGVVIVENAAQDRPFAGEPVFVADLRTPDDALSIVPWGVAADPRLQRIYAADISGQRVAVFDGEGGFVGQLGRTGDGPGEFRSPGALALSGCVGGMACGSPVPGADPAILVVLDTRRAVLSRWSGNGGFLGEERVPADYWGPGFAMGPGWFATVTSASGEMRFEQHLEVRGPGDRETLHTVAYEMVMMELPCVTMPAARIFAPDVVWTHADGTFYYLDGPGYRIDAYADGAVVASLRRPLAPVPVTREMAVAGADLPGPYQGLMRQCNVTGEELVRAVGHEDELAVVVGLAVDPGGRLWVARRGNGLMPEAVDVFAADGEYLGTHDISALPVAFLSESRFVGVRLDPSTGQAVASLYETGRGAETAVVATRRPSDSPPGTDVSVVEDPGSRPDTVPNPAGLREFRDCPMCPLMIELLRGRYLMGTSAEEEERLALIRNPKRTQHSRNAERPQIEVAIDYTFALGRYEVTFDEWDRCVDAGGCTHRPSDRGFGRGHRPVIHVSRRDAEEYLVWLRDVTGQPYRLPSSAEWEYAARAGTTTARWWGDALGEGRAVCDACGSRWDDRSTAPVGSFPPNPWGLYDMLSNVSEVVADCWHDTYEGHPTDGSPRLEAPPGWPDGECRRATWRGGGWPFFAWTVRAATRSGGNMSLDYRDDHPRAGGSRGFRVAITIPEPG